MVAYEIPAVGPAEVHVLYEGYVGRSGDDERVGVLPSPSVRPRIHASRQRPPSFATVIISGHGAPFRTGAAPGRDARS